MIKSHLLKMCLLAGMVPLSLEAFSQTAVSNQDSLSIMDSLARQEIAWNQGNIERFMETYWKSDELVFVGASGPTYGWRQVKDNYYRRYPDTASMGQLTFSILELSALGKRTILMIGKFHLSREQGEINGYFTLIWRKIRGHWLIVADHTSSTY